MHRGCPQAGARRAPTNETEPGVAQRLRGLLGALRVEPRVLVALHLVLYDPLSHVVDRDDLLPLRAPRSTCGLALEHVAHQVLQHGGRDVEALSSAHVASGQEELGLRGREVRLAAHLRGVSAALGRKGPRVDVRLLGLVRAVLETEDIS